ncbi:hypothetical protein ACIQBJ_03220 [Kitasatospora sp. NPDC088391]|uniref:hypothetical protein n=1 Tax=Kitasatospora sp. NPDC088391 TaxID=3364074 RepID=UPI00381E6698
MICPHCHVDRRQRERTHHTCDKCRKVFALDPKVEPGRLHDTKFRQLVEKATGGGLRITVEQLYWINERRLYRFPTGRETVGSVGGAVGLAVPAVVLAVVATAVGPWLWGVFAVPVLLLVLLSARQFRFRERLRPPAPMVFATSLNSFERQVIGRWRSVYHALPEGLVEHVPALPGAPMVKARAAVLCEIPAVAAFLRANDFEARHRVRLVERAALVPAGLPVVLVRDLSLAALGYAVAVRAALPGRRVVDCGLVPKAVRVPAKAVRLRGAGGAGPVDVPPALAATPAWQRLEREDRDWLVDNWTSPLITLPPAKLMAMVERAVERAVTAPVPSPAPASVASAAPDESPAETRRRAERIGFLTWPTAVPAPRGSADAAGSTGAPAARPAEGGGR